MCVECKYCVWFHLICQLVIFRCCVLTPIVFFVRPTIQINSFCIVNIHITWKPFVLVYSISFALCFHSTLCLCVVTKWIAIIRLNFYTNLDYRFLNQLEANLFISIPNTQSTSDILLIETHIHDSLMMIISLVKHNFKTTIWFWNDFCFHFGFSTSTSYRI